MAAGTELRLNAEMSPYLQCLLRAVLVQNVGQAEDLGRKTCS